MKKNKLFVSLLASGMLAVSPLMAQDVVKLTTSKAAGESVTLKLNQFKHGATVDWGDGKPVEVKSTDDNLLTIEGQVKGEGVITITSKSKITTLICSDNKLTNIDLSSAPNMRSLYCQNNELTTLDLNACKLLNDLNCSNNKISKIKVTESTHPQIENLNLADNGMTSNTGTGSSFRMSNLNLQHLDFSNNKFKSLSLPDSTNLDVLKFANNEIITMALKNAYHLSVLMCSDNGVKRVTFHKDGMPKMRQLFADGNEIADLDVSQSTQLHYLSVENNVLTSVGLPERHTLYAYACGGNKLTFSSLPGKASMPEHISYVPQDENVDITDFLKKNASRHYFMQLAPDYSDRNNEKYLLDLSSLAWDPDNKKVTLTPFGRAESETEFHELDKASNSNKTGEYFPQTSTSGYGKMSFLKPFDEVYVELTSSAYPELKFKTTHFKVTADASAIGDVVVNKEQVLNVAVRRGELIMSSAAEQTVRIYSSAGSMVWQGKVSASDVTVELPSGVYVVNGKKVVL